MLERERLRVRVDAMDGPLLVAPERSLERMQGGRPPQHWWPRCAAKSRHVVPLVGSMHDVRVGGY